MQLTLLNNVTEQSVCKRIQTQNQICLQHLRVNCDITAPVQKTHSDENAPILYFMQTLHRDTLDIKLHLAVIWKIFIQKINLYQKKRSGRQQLTEKSRGGQLDLTEMATFLTHDQNNAR